MDLKEQFYQFQAQKGCISYTLSVRLSEVTLYLSVGLCLVDKKYSVITFSEATFKHMTDSWPSTALHVKMFFLGQLASQMLSKTLHMGTDFINTASYTHTQFGLGFLPSDWPLIWDIKIL